ncbi:unnamed protein product [Symbiodinium sp. KB8]|nr:unnamed protein product [Symbiodinium sp. KB8]
MGILRDAMSGGLEEGQDKTEPQDIPNPEVPDDQQQEEGDLNEWLSGFADEAGPHSSGSNAPAKKRKPTKISVCVICKRKSEDIQWGQYDQRRDPTGDLCKRCIPVIFRIYPGMSVEEICIKYHEKTDRTVKIMVDAGISVMDGAEPRLNPPSCVQKETHQGWRVSFKVAFLTEAQLTALCDGIPPDALNMKGLKKVTIKVTDGTPTSGYLLSFVGLPQEIRDAVHKVKIFRCSGFQHHELYMPADKQLVPQQAVNTWNFLTASDLKGRVEELKTCNAAANLSKVKKEAEKVLEERVRKEQDPVKEEPHEGGTISSEDETMDDEERKRRELHKSAAAEAPMELTLQDDDATAKAPPKKRITKGSKGSSKGRGCAARSASPPAKKARGGGSQSAGAKTNTVPLNEAELAKLPPNLAKVASRLGSVPDCFYKLDPLQCFVEPLGRSVDAAGHGGLE